MCAPGAGAAADRFQPLRRLAVVGLVLCLGALSAAGAESQDTVVLRPMSASPVALTGDAVPRDDAVLRSGLIAASLAMLAETDEGHRLAIELFDDVTLAAVVDRRRETSPQRFTLSGRIVGEAAGSFSLAVNGEALAGTIRLLDGRAFRIRRGPGGLHVVEQIDLGRLAVCTLENVVPPPLGGGGGGAGGGAATTEA